MKIENNSLTGLPWTKPAINTSRIPIKLRNEIIKSFFTIPKHPAEAAKCQLDEFFYVPSLCTNSLFFRLVHRHYLQPAQKSHRTTGDDDDDDGGCIAVY